MHSRWKDAIHCRMWPLHDGNQQLLLDLNYAPAMPCNVPM